MIPALLWALLWALLTLLGGVLILALLALATPVHLALRAELGAASRFALRLRLFGGLTPWLVVADSAHTPPEPPPEPKAEPKPPKRRRGWRLPAGSGWRLARELPGFVLGALRRIRIERLAVEADLGLGDPADTGRLFGYLMPLQHALHLPRTHIDLRPDFARLRCDGSAEAVLRLIPLALLIPALGLAWRVLWVRA
jgi:hypothetical protein